ncbi:hypothetical protein UFOVP760_256 [uncultured Caudovirales phage]|uniref:Uncharacterized protein n=1 Tax=uncultured Caudovirales phage TaxID=2100421 RepID=A0A6J7X997_9CAUD|nr:hypothetical protein UFOVP760_256 [uncultured Caudovirales phage]
MNQIDAIDQGQKGHELNLGTGDRPTNGHHTDQVDGVEGG